MQVKKTPKQVIQQWTASGKKSETYSFSLTKEENVQRYTIKKDDTMPHVAPIVFFSLKQ